jgi:hypothetical protein
VFAKGLSRCLAEVEREQWEAVLSFCGGDVRAAARECGLEGVGAGAKVLWGRSSEEALNSYRHWQERRAR